MGSTNDAVATLEAARRDQSDSLNRIEAALSAKLTTLQAFEDAGLDANTIRPVNVWTDPLWVATGLLLTAHGRFDDAISWAGGACMTRRSAPVITFVTKTYVMTIHNFRASSS